jgi:hypothetical protein
MKFHPMLRLSTTSLVLEVPVFLAPVMPLLLMELLPLKI